MDLLLNPYFLLLAAIVIGQAIGKIEYNYFSLGSAGSLFAGLLLSYGHYRFLMATGEDLTAQYTIVSKQLFVMSLIGFVASVGLIAGKDIKKALKNNGIKFFLLSLVVTLTGAISTFVIGKLFLRGGEASVIGTYVGALTSSPGLATALELGPLFGQNGQAMVGLGYSVAYVPGVILVVLFVQFQGRLLKKDPPKDTLKPLAETPIQSMEQSFSVVSFTFVAMVGILIGSIEVPLGEAVGTFSLGKTGGVLVSALYLGHCQRFLGMNFSISPMVLKGIRDISLNIFLAIVGLNYGYQVIRLGKNAGLILFMAGLLTAALSILAGYFVGRKILYIERVPLVGGLCGGMTSTPGLASAIEAIESDEVTVYYGATYPFALLLMIIFTNILSRVLI